jgi:hypothetical protein
VSRMANFIKVLDPTPLNVGTLTRFLNQDNCTFTGANAASTAENYLTLRPSEPNLAYL